MKSTKEFSLCNAMKNNMSRTWQKTLAVLVAMVVFTVSPVITVMAAARQVNITVDGETSSSMITMACESEADARAILAQNSYEVSAEDLVSFGEDGSAVFIRVRSALSHGFSRRQRFGLRCIMATRSLRRWAMRGYL